MTNQKEYNKEHVAKGCAIMIIIALLFIGGCYACSEKTETTTIKVESKTYTPYPMVNKEKTVEVNEKPTAPTERDKVLKKLKSIAQRDWPNDYSTQEFWINQEMEDYDYMINIEDNPIKRQAQRDWPFDFSTQKFWYNEQLEAKERLSK